MSKLNIVSLRGANCFRVCLLYIYVPMPYFKAIIPKICFANCIDFCMIKSSKEVSNESYSLQFSVGSGKVS